MATTGTFPGPLRALAKDRLPTRRLLAAGTPDYYKVARVVLWAEWKAGHQLKTAESNKPETRFKPMSQPATQPGSPILTDRQGLKAGQQKTHRREAMS